MGLYQTGVWEGRERECVGVGVERSNVKVVVVWGKGDARDLGRSDFV